MQWAERLDIHTLKTLSFGPRETLYYPKMVSEAKSQVPQIFGEHAPRLLKL